MVNIMLYLQKHTNIKSYMIYRSAPFSITLNDPYSDFKVTQILGIEYGVNGPHLGLQWITNINLYTPYSSV